MPKKKTMTVEPDGWNELPELDFERGIIPANDEPNHELFVFQLFGN